MHLRSVEITDIVGIADFLMIQAFQNNCSIYHPLNHNYQYF